MTGPHFFTMPSFECQLRRKGQYKAKMNVDGDKILCHAKDHTRPPSQTNCEAVRIKSSIKGRAEETYHSPNKF